MDKVTRNKTNRKSRQKIYIALSTVLLGLAIMFGTYYYMSNRVSFQYINTLYSEKENIDKANSLITETIKKLNSNSNNPENINELKSSVIEAESKIQDSLDRLKKYNPPAQYNMDFNNYLKAISLNKKLYNQTNLILKNSNSKDAFNAIDTLSKLIDEIKITYEKSNAKKATIKLPNEITNLPEVLNQITLVEYKKHEEKNRLLEQYTTYFDSMEMVIQSLNVELTNLNDNLMAMKNNETSIESVYMAIENKLSNLATIKSEYSKISVPAALADSHKLFEEILKSYNYYCQDFKSALTKLEQSGNYRTEIDFIELDGNFQEISAKFEEYVTKFNDNKNFYTNPDNIKKQ
ncbi:hypothetical protein Q428_13770 [Fervidicella metallireducens AeB]|uniref:Uncharacterized protein n=1 Tax=Fervidicella metallireducens AeB TaxID=1403537 RepID=A0A017RRG3_9CLOT|nr:hypothetical protein [Fervidicella metallireducens]EYE87358.1 hypothetical protein Q428_13770 [Fervidicella metallireducens AeB]